MTDELLEKRLKDERKVRSKRNLVQGQVFSEKLRKALESLGLTDDEVAFYDALAANDSAVQAMGDAKLKLIAA